MRLSFPERIAGAIAAVLAGLAAALVLWLIDPRAARAAAFDCADLAMVAGAAADFRDAGAKVDGTVRVARLRNNDRTQDELDVIEREVRRVFQEKLPRRQAVANLYGRCRRAGGRMGVEG